MADGELYTVFVDASPQLPLPAQPTDEIAIVRNLVTYKASPGTVLGGNLVGGIGFTTYVSPVSGATIVATLGQGAFEIELGAPIAVLHLVLPPGAVEGQVFEIATTQDIDNLDAIGAGIDNMAGTSGTVGVLAANGGASWRYRLLNSTWYRRQ